MTPPPGAAPRLHVFWLTAAPDDDVTGGDTVLTSDERARVQRWGNLPRAREFMLGRWLLHHAASSFGLPRGWLAFADSGRPRVVGRPDTDVSLSHAGQQVVVALCEGGVVGVDIETHQPRERALMDRFFHADESAWMGQDLSRLHRLWTMKEAALKALGTGVSGDPRRVHVEPGTDRITVDGAPEGTLPYCASFSRDTFSAAVVVFHRADVPAPSLSLHRVTLSTLRAELTRFNSPRITA